MTEYEKIKNFTPDEMARYMLELITAAQTGSLEIAKILLSTTMGQEKIENVKAQLMREAE